MKILHIVQGYTPAIGGTELFIQKLSEHLVKQYQDEVTVFTTNTAKNSAAFWLRGAPTLPVGSETINGVTVRRFAVFNRFGFMRHKLAKLAYALKLPFNDWLRAVFDGPLIFNMSREIARFGADVITASSFPFLHMRYAVAGGKQSQTPVILCGALHPTDSWSFERAMIYKTIQQADAYVAHSKFEQDYVIKRGLAAEKAYTIGVGLDLAPFSKASGVALRQSYGWADALVIVFVGHLANRKGVPHLLRAMPQVWAQFPEAKLLLAGASTHYLGRIEQLIAQLAPEYRQNVVIKADFPEGSKAEIFATCDILVLPSTEESFGIVFLEAWACSKPVIGLRAGAVPTIIAEGEDGLLAQPGDTADLARVICKLLANPQQRARLGQAGYQKVKNNYTWEIVTDKFRRVYEEVRS